MSIRFREPEQPACPLITLRPRQEKSAAVQQSIARTTFTGSGTAIHDRAYDCTRMQTSVRRFHVLRRLRQVIAARVGATAAQRRSGRV